MKKFLIFVIAITLNQAAFAQISSLKEEVAEVIENKNITLGIALYDFSNGDTLSINGNRQFPMKSVYKFHIALAVLDQVDKKRFELDQMIFIPKADLLPNTWSPIRKKYPDGDIELPLSEIIKYTVAQSDNNGCDILLEMLGGASTVNTYIHNQGVSDINIQSTEQELNASWDLQFLNWTTPNSVIQLLKLFNTSISTSPTRSFLWQTMVETSTGSIKNKLPKNVIVAHKTGYSGYKDGVCAANNDVGIMVLPDGRHIAFAIFITDSTEAADINYSIIADIAEIIYNQ